MGCDCRYQGYMDINSSDQTLSKMPMPIYSKCENISYKTVLAIKISYLFLDIVDTALTVRESLTSPQTFFIDYFLYYKYQT